MSLISLLITLYIYVIIAWAVMSMLVSFGIVDSYHPLLRKIIRFLDKMCEPVMTPVRRILPPAGGLDIAPVLVIVGLAFLNDVLMSVAYGGSIALPLVRALDILLSLYMYVVITLGVLGTLINLKIVSGYQPLVQKIMLVLRKLCEPALRRVRRHVPVVNGFDIPALLLALGIYGLLLFLHRLV